MAEEEKKPKQLDLTESCIKTLAKVAIDNDKVFKTFCEEVLENLAKKHQKG